MRVGRIGAALVAVIVVVALVLGYRTYVAPRTDPLPPAARPADAVLALGGTPRVATYAASLAAAGHARTLVVSDPYPTPNEATRLCSAPPADLVARIICFRPEPSTTRGEAEELRTLARAHGWHTVIVVAPAFHISRARLIVGRCFTGDLRMASVPMSFGIATWVYEWGYQTGAFVLAETLRRGC